MTGPAAPVSVLIATRDRPEALRRALASVAAQQPGPAEVIVLDNASGSPLDTAALSVPGAALRVVRTETMLGVGGARRLLCEAAHAPLALLLDDDAWLPDTATIGQVTAHFAARPASAALGFTVANERPDGVTWRTPLGTRPQAPEGPEREAGCFLGGAHALRLDAVRAVGGYDPAFAYGEEELDLTYRLVAAGYGVWYAPALVARHRRPAHEPPRDPATFAASRLQGRAYLAARYLPLPYAATYVLAWSAYTFRLLPGRPGPLIRAVREGVRRALREGRQRLPDAALQTLRRTGGRLWM